MSVLADVNESIAFCFNLISISTVVFRAIGVTMNRKSFAVMQAEKAQHEMRRGMIMKITGKIADG